MRRVRRCEGLTGESIVANSRPAYSPTERKWELGIYMGVDSTNVRFSVAVPDKFVIEQQTLIRVWT
jgi:hypothetical protein